MSTRARLLGGALAAALAVVPLGAQTVGERLPAWSAGTLDIHQINTGRGNAALLVLPDGTSLLLDAGNGGNLPPRGTPPRPDASRTPGEWIARYARAMGLEAIDYAYLTHFHDDHMDGLVDVAQHIPIRKVIDRGWPDYAFPPGDRSEFARPEFARYRDWVKSGQVAAERFLPGVADQIVLTRDRAKYPQLEIRNIAANGEVWTGQGTQTRRVFPAFEALAGDDMPTENMCSQVMRLRYGAFDYYSGGDIPGNLRPGYPAWQDIETPVAAAVGAVDVALLDHHGNRDSMNARLVSTLRPRIWVIPVWSSDHPGHDVLERLYSERLYPGPRDVFATNMLEPNKLVIGPLLDRLVSSQGHVLVRVEPGGASYRVVVLDDTAETWRVKSVHGPYTAR